MSFFEMRDESVTIEPAHDRKKYYCLRILIISAIFLTLLFQLMNFALFAYIVTQLTPLKTQIDPIINKSAAILGRVNEPTFSNAVNKLSVIVGQTDQTKIVQTIEKITDIFYATNTTAFNTALAKTVHVVNDINDSLLLESINNIEYNVLPSINRLLPIIENNVTPTFDRLVPVFNEIPNFINNTENFIAEIRKFFKHSQTSSLTQKGEWPNC